MIIYDLKGMVKNMNTESTKKRLAIAGCGKLGNILTDAWRSGLLPEYEIVGVLGRDRERAGSMASKAGCPAFETIEEIGRAHV